MTPASSDRSLDHALVREPAEFFCSTIIPTVGRATLERAVRSVLEQNDDLRPCEVIVVNDSGRPLPDALWQQSPFVRMLTTQRQERCHARNAGAGVARGRYLHFLDDDDELLPDAFDAFWRLSRQFPDATWLSGGWEIVDNAGTPLAAFAPRLTGNISALLVSGESIPLQASLLAASAVRFAGGFDPALVGVEDRDLGRRISLHGDVASSATFVARVRVGEEGSTTVWSTLAEADRKGRERALDEPAAFRALRDSSCQAMDIRGRTTRAYLASAAWNVRQGQCGRAIERVGNGVLLAGPSVWHPDFWRGLFTPNP
ncbi:MAG: glycosyltransferase [Vicinamibacterales bacterium]